MTILGGGFGGRGAGGAGPAGKVGPAATGQGGSVPYVTERDFEAVVLRSEVPVLLEFTADWCQPCKAIAPEVEAFAREVAGKAKVVKIDIDKSPAIAQQLRIQSVPTFMVVAEGRIQDGVVGAIRKKKMHELVEPFFPRSAGALKPAELAQLIAGGAVSPIDTRDAGAFGRAHLPGAVNMPIEEIESRLAELHMLQAQPVLYCRGGDKTKELSERLTEQGLPVAFLEGGLLAWEAEGLPIQR
jgi:thioredoxin